MLDAKEARELLFYTSLNSDRLHVLGLKEIMDAQILARTEDLLKKHFRSLRDIFRYYSSPSPNGTQGITMEGILRLYHDCKLRSKELAPHHLESIFHEQMDLNRSSEPVLSPQNFIEVLLVFSNLKFRHTMDQVPSQFLYLVENHLQPYACQDQESIFQRMTFDPKVREVLESHSKELQIIFQIYAEADDSTADALSKVNTMNVKEFQMLLSHCEMLDELLTDSAVTNIFEGIQQSCSDTDAGGDMMDSPSHSSSHRNLSGSLGDASGDDHAGMDDDDELAFSEFLDGLVAITAYKEPDPFTPFHTRVNRFILTLFGELRRHWSRKRGNARVDTLLNALQKKLKNADHKASVVNGQPKLSLAAARMSTISITMARSETTRSRSGSAEMSKLPLPNQEEKENTARQRPNSASPPSPIGSPTSASRAKSPIGSPTSASQRAKSPIGFSGERDRKPGSSSPPSGRASKSPSAKDSSKYSSAPTSMEKPKESSKENEAKDPG